MELWLKNSFPMVKLWPAVSIQMFCGVYGKTSGENDPRSDALWICFCTTTMMTSLCFVCAGISGQKRQNCCSALSLFLRYGTLRLLFQNSNWHWTRWRFDGIFTIQKQQQTTLTEFKTTLPTARSLGSLYQVARELLQRGQYGISGKYRYKR